MEPKPIVKKSTPGAKNSKASELNSYGKLLADIKKRIQQAQTKAILSVNAEMILMYWDIGRIIADRQKNEGWGAGVIPRLSKDLHNELPEQKGFSERNLKFMVQLYKVYEEAVIGKQAVSQLRLLFRILYKVAP